MYKNNYKEAYSHNFSIEVSDKAANESTEG